MRSLRTWVILAAVLIGGSCGDSEGESDCGAPLEQTCRYGDDWPGVRCSDDAACVDGEWACPGEGRLVSSRGCLADCRTYAEDHPECTCSSDSEFGYEVSLECSAVDATEARGFVRTEARW